MNIGLTKVSDEFFEVSVPQEQWDVRSLNSKIYPTGVKLKKLFDQRVSKNNLKVPSAHFKKETERLEGIPRFRWNHEMELAGYNTADHNKESSLSTFGGFRYINQISFFIDYLGWNSNLSEKVVLDIGPWSGSSSVIYEALGGRVDAVEEGERQLELMSVIRDSFGLSFEIVKDSLYNVDAREKYDLISNFGVLYHVTDPLIFLRICANALKPGGIMLLETMSTNEFQSESIMRYEGSFKAGGNWFVPNRLALLNIMQDAGFENIKIVTNSNNKKNGRAYAFGQKRQGGDTWKPLRLGWSKLIE